MYTQLVLFIFLQQKATSKISLTYNLKCILSHYSKY
nr:MAG TPA: hypothetical protein [Inoviridae sp.]